MAQAASKFSSFLGEPQGQPGEPLRQGPGRQVVPLDVGGAYRDRFALGHAEYWPAADLGSGEPSYGEPGKPHARIALATCGRAAL